MTTTPSDKELPEFKTGGLAWRSFVGLVSERGLPMREAHLSAQLAALDPSTRARVLVDALVAMGIDGAERVFREVIGLPAEGGALTQAWKELTSTRAEVERLRAALTKLRDEAHSARPVGHRLAVVLEVIATAFPEPAPPGLVNYGMDSDE